MALFVFVCRLFSHHGGVVDGGGGRSDGGGLVALVVVVLLLLVAEQTHGLDRASAAHHNMSAVFFCVLLFGRFVSVYI